ncbi:alpha/beta fold hydrolase [Actinomycetospora cinnamomea]|uniref:Pimeloyl-ACP methyl ester carboxylesterase n=1 Tax=Actinomycetospora cinnamomea TaxID=663609 RepID=A0A2U1F2P2_9PSEU|nr:alpha/beta hydrolase [Actinomycetospora cinnamomea]PVZ06399.1 pimeloyl-ACP methyl ester carboxylesterase [Actinomycetospora cinnamomea]
MPTGTTVVAGDDARDRIVVVDGLSFHVRELGDAAAPAVVVLHGIMGHAREWDTLTEGLGDAFHVLAVDQRGHGRTPWADEYTAIALADDVAAVIAALGLGRAHLVGHSMGAMAASVCAAERPDLVDHLVLVDLAPDVPDTDFCTRELPAMLAAFADASYATVQEPLDEWLAANPLADPRHLRHYVEHGLVRRDDGRLVWRFDGVGLARFVTDGLTSAQLWRALDRLAAPTLVIRGEQSPLLSSDTAAAMVRRLDRGSLVEIAGGGHDLGVERPGAVTAAVRAFLGAPTVDRRPRSGP